MVQVRLPDAPGPCRTRSWPARSPAHFHAVTPQVLDPSSRCTRQARSTSPGRVPTAARRASSSARVPALSCSSPRADVVPRMPWRLGSRNRRNVRSFRHGPHLRPRLRRAPGPEHPSVTPGDWSVGESSAATDGSATRSVIRSRMNCAAVSSAARSNSRSSNVEMRIWNPPRAKYLSWILRHSSEGATTAEGRGASKGTARKLLRAATRKSGTSWPAPCAAPRRQ